MSITNELIPVLKKLRLSGILQTLDLRTKEAVNGSLGHAEFLFRLCSDEVERREAKQLELRLRRASFEVSRRLEDFDWSFNPQVPKSKIIDLAACHFIEKQENALLIGPAGVGKSHIAQAMFSLVIENDVVSIAIYQAEIYMHTVTAHIGNWLWHKRQDYPVLKSNLTGHLPKQKYIVYRFDGIVVSQGKFKLGRVIFTGHAFKGKTHFRGLLPDSVSKSDRICHRSGAVNERAGCFIRAQLPFVIVFKRKGFQLDTDFRC